MGWQNAGGWQSGGWAGAAAGGGGGGGVTLDAAGSTFSVGSTGTQDYTGLTVGTADLLIGLICIRGTPPTINSVNWDATGTPQAMTQITSQLINTGTTNLYIYALKNPTAGNKTLRVDITPATNPIQISAASYNSTNAALANAIPSGSIIQGNSGGVNVASWSMSAAADTITIPSGKKGLILNAISINNTSGSTWSPTPTASTNNSFNTGYLALNAGTSNFIITGTGGSDVAAGIGIVISG